MEHIKQVLQRIRRNTPLFIVSVALVSGIVGFAAVAALSSRGQHKVATKTQCDGTCVDLYSTSASPDTVTVTSGSYVQFNSKDGQSHSLVLGEDAKDATHHTAHAAGSIASGEFKANEAWRVQFKEDGAYSFRDLKHPEVKILVVVYTAGKDYKIK